MPGWTAAMISIDFVWVASADASIQESRSGPRKSLGDERDFETEFFRPLQNVDRIEIVLVDAATVSRQCVEGRLDQRVRPNGQRGRTPNAESHLRLLRRRPNLRPWMSCSVGGRAIDRSARDDVLRRSVGATNEGLNFLGG